jgi:hypothetical protein
MNEYEAYGDVNSGQQSAVSTHNPFADLKSILSDDGQDS